MPPSVLVLYNEPTLPPDHPDADSEHDILYTADTVARILQQAGLRVRRLGLTADPAPLVAALATPPDVVFNLYEGLAQWGNTEAYVAGLLELLGVPFTGSPTQPLLLCRSKPLTKQLLAGAGLPTAPFFVVGDGPVPECPLAWPVIVKPGREDASVGIDQGSVVTNQTQLEDRVAYIRAAYGPSVLVEQFVRGREFNVALVDFDGHITPLPFSEILFVPPSDAPDLWPIVSFDAKWRPGTADFVATPARNPADVTPALHAAVAALAKQAFDLVGCRDYARVDFRIDAAGRPVILEVNPNPCISPLAGLAAGLESARVPYPDFILGRVRAALQRGKRPELADAVGAADPAGRLGPHGPVGSGRRGVRVRPARRADLAAAVELAAGPDAEPLRGWLESLTARRTPAGPRAWVAVADRAVIGILVGRPMADVATGVVDAVFVAPSHRRRGVAALLFDAAERAAAAGGARWLLAHVSSGPADAAARHLLTRTGWQPAGDIPDFTKDGYARLTFARPVAPVEAPTPTPDRARPAAGAG